MVKMKTTNQVSLCLLAEQPNRKIEENVFFKQIGDDKRVVETNIERSMFCQNMSTLVCLSLYKPNRVITFTSKTHIIRN